MAPAWLHLFAPEELQLLISGSGRVDVADWRQHTVYHGWQREDENTILRWFWEMVDEMTDTQRQQLLLFATSCSRAPLLGFGALQPKFCVYANLAEPNALPSASTCMNLFKMPRYQSKAQMKHKVLYAIASGAGFDMS
jgi:ubiquitin-protein ligase E3 C